MRAIDNSAWRLQEEVGVEKQHSWRGFFRAMIAPWTLISPWVLVHLSMALGSPTQISGAALTNFLIIGVVLMVILHGAANGLDGLGRADIRCHGRMAYCVAVGPRVPQRRGSDVERRRRRHSCRGRVWSDWRDQAADRHCLIPVNIRQLQLSTWPKPVLPHRLSAKAAQMATIR